MAELAKRPRQDAAHRRLHISATDGKSESSGTHGRSADAEGRTGRGARRRRRSRRHQDTIGMIGAAAGIQTPRALSPDRLRDAVAALEDFSATSAQSVALTHAALVSPRQY